MLDLTYENKIHLDKWDIDVKPYLTLQEIESIVKQLIMKPNDLERDMCLIANILVVCTDIYNSEEEAKYTYEDILYSGFWADLLENCPILIDNIKVINRAVNEFFSIDKKIYAILDMAVDKMNDLDLSEILKILNDSDIMDTLKGIQSNLSKEHNYGSQK